MKKMKDLVTIIIPYFKKKSFFKKTINSVFNQSYKNYEIILIYDDVNKSELKYVRYILQKIKKKKIIINKKNLGVGKTKVLKKQKVNLLHFLMQTICGIKIKLKIRLTL